MLRVRYRPRALPLKTFGQRLKWARETSDVTQRELAAAVGVHEPAVSRWENDHDDPRLAHLRAIGHTLNLNLHWLVTGRGPQWPPKE